MTNTRKQLSRLIKSGILPVENIDEALTLCKVSPSQINWKHFISNLLLWLGALAICFSVLFFIAYNWNELGRFAKFGLVEALIGLSIFLYWKSNNRSQLSTGLVSNISQTTQGVETKHKQRSAKLISKVALLMASIFVGVLLAFYGQTYQTGADPWQLFFMWAILITPWVIISGFPVLWIVWLSLINLSIVLYFKIFNGFFGIVFSDQTNMLWIISGVNSVAFILWELLKTRRPWMLENWITRLVAFASGAPLTFLVMESIFERSSSNLFPILFWVIGMFLIYWFYRKVKIDVFMLAMACLSGIIVVISGVSYVLFNYLGGDIGSFLLLAMLVISLGAASAIWLKRLYLDQQLHDKNLQEPQQEDV